MNNKPVLDTIEPELLNRVISRRQALLRAGGITAGVASAPLILALCSRDAFGAFLPDQIRDTLNFAIMLERMEEGFYEHGLKTKGLIPQQHRKSFERIHKNESAHAKLLAAALVGQREEKKEFDYTAGGRYPDVFSSFDTFSALSQMFEDTGVRAYKGQGANVMGNNILLTIALRIHSVEARHAAEVRRIRGQKAWIAGSNIGNLPPTAQPSYKGEDNTMQGTVQLAGLAGVPETAVTEAFDEPLTKDQVLAIVNPFIKGAERFSPTGRS